MMKKTFVEELLNIRTVLKEKKEYELADKIRSLLVDERWEITDLEGKTKAEFIGLDYVKMLKKDLEEKNEKLVKADSLLYSLYLVEFRYPPKGMTKESLLKELKKYNY